MTKGKSYNRIVFFTTLSVYLGLVLAGATPQVLSYAATTRAFDIRNEIEFKDDLDNKPDEDLIAQSIIGIASNLDKFSKSKEFNWETKSEISVEGLGFCKSDNSPAFEGSSLPSINERIYKIISEDFVRIGRNLNKLKSDSGLGDFYEGYPEGINFDLVTNHRALDLEITVNLKSDEIAQKFFNLVNSSVSKNTSLSKKSKSALIYENTQVSFKNNQVFIVTRLPRGSIDSLLAKND